MRRFHFWRTRETDRERWGEKKKRMHTGGGGKREGMETKFREDEAPNRTRRWARKRGDDRGREGLREDSRIGMETRYAMDMGSHACVSSGPAGGDVCSFFRSSFSLSPAVPLTILTDLSFLAALYRSSAFGSMPVRKLLVLPTFPFLSFPPAALFLRHILAPNFGVSFK